MTFFLIVINVVFKWFSVLLRHIFLVTEISLSKEGQLEFRQIGTISYQKVNLQTPIYNFIIILCLDVGTVPSIKYTEFSILTYFISTAFLYITQT